MKKTKIVCTMGPQENDIDLLSRMIEAGMDVARFNFSHGTHEEQAERMESVRKARERTGRPIAMLLDTKGPEIRTGLLVDHKKVTLEAGKEIILTTEDIEGTAEKVSITSKRSRKLPARTLSARSSTAENSPSAKAAMCPASGHSFRPSRTKISRISSGESVRDLM